MRFFTSKKLNAMLSQAFYDGYMWGLSRAQLRLEDFYKQEESRSGAGEGKP